MYIFTNFTGQQIEVWTKGHHKFNNKKLKEMGKKGAMPNFKTIDDYIANQTEEAQIILHELRDLIKEAAPESVEIQNYKVPSFTLVSGVKPENQLMMVAYKNYISLYPHEKTVEYFRDELKGFDLGKGTVQFQFREPLPKDIIKRMVVFRKEELMSK